MLRGAPAVAPLVAMLVAAGPARAESPPTSPPPSTDGSRGLVVVLSPDNEDEVTHNAMSRIRGELGAAPFTVVNRTLDPKADVMSQLETAGQDLSPVAAFGIVREPSDSPQGVAVWVSNRITRTTSVHRVAIRAGDVDGAAAELAIEAVELVRASMAGLWPSPEGDRPAPKQPRAPDGVGLALSIAAGVVAPIEDAPVFLTPTVGVSWGRPGAFGVRLWALGLGPDADVSAGGGAGARVQRAAAALEAIRVFRPDAIVQPMLALGAGVHYLNVRGTGVPLERRRDLDSWSALVSAGGGVAIVLGPHVALTAEIEGLLALPPQVIQIDGVNLATFERPSLFVRGGVLARL